MITDLSQITLFGNGNILQTAAGSESIVTDYGNTVTEGDIIQTGTLIESIVTDTDQILSDD